MDISQDLAVDDDIESAMLIMRTSSSTPYMPVKLQFSGPFMPTPAGEVVRSLGGQVIMASGVS